MLAIKADLTPNPEQYIKIYWMEVMENVSSYTSKGDRNGVKALVKLDTLFILYVDGLSLVLDRNYRNRITMLGGKGKFVEVKV